MRILLPLLFVLIFTASAADVTGTWKAAIETPNGPFETTFHFKADGAKLTGSTSNRFQQDAPISEGKIDGDQISFVVVGTFQGNEIRVNYKGKLAGDEIKLTFEVAGRDGALEMTAKRSK
jgi:hypothetical protein